MLISSLVNRLCELGAPISLPATDEILCADLDDLRSVEPRLKRLVCLRQAKQQALEEYLQACIDEIAEAAAAGSVTADVLLGGFVGADSAAVPYSHATLQQTFYGAPLSGPEVRRWTRLARVAADVHAVDRSQSGPEVYFVSLGDPSLVKIGYTANFNHRLRALRTASAADPVVHLTMAGSKSLEAELHARFASDHVRREWFRLSAQIQAFIDQNQ